MEIRTTRSMHPLTAIAAVSVTLFSLAGIGAITGLIPTSHSQTTVVPVSAPMPARLNRVTDTAAMAVSGCMLLVVAISMIVSVWSDAHRKQRIYGAHVASEEAEQL